MSPPPDSSAPGNWRDVLETSIVDQLIMLEGASPGFFAQVAESYYKTGRDNLQAIKDAAGAGDHETLQRRAHALLGSSRQVGAKDLGGLCREIEHSESVASAAGPLAKLDAEFDRTEAALRAAVESAS